jgi:predicted HicB family RNase H-like nuclease
MAISEARHRANEKYNAKAYEEIKIRVSKGKKEIIQSAAKASGESVNAYINRAIDLLMGGGYGIQSGDDEENI